MKERIVGIRLLGAVVVALALGGLAACGGGETGGTDKESFTGEIPVEPGAGGTTPPPGGGATPPGGGATPPAEEPPAEEPPAEEPPVEEPPEVPVPTDPPIEPPAPRDPPIEAPPPPEPLPSFPGFGDVHGTTADPRNGTHYFADAATGQLFALPPGPADPVEIQMTGVENIHGLAFDPATEVFYATVVADGVDSALFRIPLSGPATRIGDVTAYQVLEGLAWHTGRGTLYGTDAEKNVLLSIDTTTAAPTEIGPFGGAHESLAGLACDADDDTLYATGPTTADIVAIDPDSGAARRMATLVEGPMDGLGYDPTSRLFLASSANGSTLFTIDPRGEWITGNQILGLAWGPDRGVLYGSHVGHAILVRIERESGWRQSVGYLGIPLLEGLTWDPLARAGEGGLVGISSATRALYEIDPDSVSVRTLGTVHGATESETWGGLAGLARVEGELVAVDRETGALLSLSRADALATLLATAPDGAGVHSLAYDAGEGFLHAFGREPNTHLVFDVRGAYRPIEPGASPYDHIGALTWMPDEQRVLGWDVPGDAAVTIYRTPPEANLHDAIVALARAPSSDGLLGFDLAEAAVVDVDATEQQSSTLASHPGLTIEAMADDPAHGVVYGADSASGSLYRIGSDGSAVRIGAAGAFGDRVIHAMAYDQTRDVLWAVDAVTRFLLTIDTDDGEAHVVDPDAAPLPFVAIEAMTWDSDTEALIAVDAASHDLFEIDVDTQDVIDFASIEPASVHAMVSVPGTGTLLVVDSDLDRIVVIDRFTGETVEPYVALSTLRSGSESRAAVPLWPRGDVRVAGLDTFALQVSLDYEGDGTLVFRRGDETLFQRTFAPEKIVTVEKLPKAVLDALETGDELVWGLVYQTQDDVLVSLRVGPADEAGSALAAAKKNPYLRRQPPLWRGVVDARLLARHGLHAESLERFVAVAAHYGANLAVQRGVVRALGALGDPSSDIQSTVADLDRLGRALLEARAEK